MKTDDERRAERIEKIADVIERRLPTQIGNATWREDIAAHIHDQLYPPPWVENPMESEDLVTTHTYRCAVTGAYYHVTLRGPFLQKLA